MSMRIKTLFSIAIASLIVVQVEAEVPEELETIVFGDEKRESIAVTVNGIDFEALTVFSESPYLLWPKDDKLVEFPATTDDWSTWLNAAADSLGYDGLEAVFDVKTNWKSNEVWQFKLVANDLQVHDARIEVHLQDKRILGIVNHTPSPIDSIEIPAAVAPDESWIYYPVRNEDLSYTLSPAKVKERRLANRTELTIEINDVAVASIVTASGTNQFQWADPSLAFFKEFNVPAGTFPDQISVDEDGDVWFSQPNNNWLTRFDPSNASFHQISTLPGTTPDGMIVGTQGRVWAGMYNSSSLGMWDIPSQTFNNYTAPYANANMAIPVETSDGMIWVTDHIRNRISEFDPVTETWQQSLVMPTANCWVVQGYEDRDNGNLYMTEYNSNQLGVIAVGGNQVVDIPVPGGGPAFCVYDQGKVYYSRWNEAGIGVYDVNTQQITEYQFPVANESGGPLWIAPNGKIVTGTRNRGYIMIFDPTDQSMEGFQIPTASPGLKDGMTVAPNGVIWFTETGANKIAKLRLMPLLPRGIAPK